MDLSKLTEVREVSLRSTGVSDYERCPRYFLFRHRAGLVSKSASSPALARGDTFHHIVADLLRGKTRDQAEQSALTLMGETVEKSIASVGPAGYLPNGQTPDENAKAIESNTRVAIAMSRAYSRFFNVGPGTISGLRVLDGTIEMNMSASESGTLDLIAADGNNQAYVVDHKTSGWDLVQYARTLPLAAQSLIYPRLLASYLSRPGNGSLGMVPAGICYCIIKTPTIRCCKTDDFDLTKYASRVEKWYEDNPDETMLRTFIRPSQELVRYSGTRLDNVRRACVSLPVLDNFPATGGSPCQAYNTLCPYLGLCTSDTVRWPKELERFDRAWRDEENDE